MDRYEWTRRKLIGTAGVGATLCVLGGLAAAEGSHKGGIAEAGKKKEEGVSPNEDLMREHGLLDRVLLVYEEGIRRIESGQDLSSDVIAGSAAIVRRFIEDYHEKLEEDFLFTRFEKAGQLLELVATLRAQHQAGRQLTGAIQELSTAAALKEPGARGRLVESIRLFVRMYRPHAAREDTVLFPAFHQLVSGREYDTLGDRFEAQEHQLFGADGFESILREVVNLEHQLGIDDLARFTPA